MSEVYVPILQGHVLYFATEQDCFRYTVEGGMVERSEVPMLSCSHEEADTRIIFHASFEASASPDASLGSPAHQNVIVCHTIDTDVFVLLLYHA